MKLSDLPGKKHKNASEIGFPPVSETTMPWPNARRDRVWIVNDIGFLSGTVYWVLVDDDDEVIETKLIAIS